MSSPRGVLGVTARVLFFFSVVRGPLDFGMLTPEAVCGAGLARGAAAALFLIFNFVGGSFFRMARTAFTPPPTGVLGAEVSDFGELMLDSPR